MKTVKLNLSKYPGSRPLAVFVLFIIMFLFPKLYLHGIANRAIVLWINQLIVSTGSLEAPVPISCIFEKQSPSWAYVTFGRINFAQENYREAIDCYEQALDLVEKNPFAFAEMTIALSHIDLFEEVVVNFELQREFILRNPRAREAVLLAYLNQFDAGRITIATMMPAFQELGPDELYTRSLVLREQLGVIQLQELPLDVQEQLIRFAMEDVAPKDGRLLDYTVRLLPELMHSGLWDDQRLMNVLRFWVWRYPESASLAELLDNFTISYPEAADWTILRAELNSRREQQAVSRTGNDVTVSDGGDNNMIGNGSYDVVSHEWLPGWRIADYKTGRREGETQAAFFMDVDALINTSPPYALRIDGLWDERADGFFGAVALRSAYEGTYMLSILPHQSYQVTGFYRTQGASERASIYIGNPEVELFNISLPATSGEWQTFTNTGCHIGDQIEFMQLLLRVHSSGSVWFDNLMLQPIDLVADGCLP